jgi:hypothetical protein
MATAATAPKGAALARTCECCATHCARCSFNGGMSARVGSDDLALGAPWSNGLSSMATCSSGGLCALQCATVSTGAVRTHTQRKPHRPTDNSIAANAMLWA